MRMSWMATALAVLSLAPPLFAGEVQKADEVKKPSAKTYLVPYRLTNFNHVMVRAKINGKGPFNFIVDTGAPALFVSTAAAKKAGVAPGRNGWGTFDRFELEGGVVLEKAKGRIEDPFQLKGMNGLGLAGVELHGMIGYTILAQYRITFDFSKNKLAFTPLDFEPPAPVGLGSNTGTGGLNAMGAIMDMLGKFLGKQAEPEVLTRGFMGMDVAEDGKGGVVVKSVLPKGPADLAGVQVGDRITEFHDRTVRETEDVRRYLSHLEPDEKTPLTVQRNGEEHELTIKIGEGF